MSDETPGRGLYEFVEPEPLAVEGLAALLADEQAPLGEGEASYRRWFVSHAMEPLVRTLYAGDGIETVSLEKKLRFTNYRADVLLHMSSGLRVAFELKAMSRRHPQTARFALMQGVGQALLYHDVLNATGRADVLLVSDVVHPTIPPLVLRHGLPIGVVEANSRRIVCAHPGRDVH